MREKPGRALGRVGVWTFAFDGQPASRVREAAAEIEELGYGAIWYGEAFGRDTVGQAWLLLSATRHLTVASGIANIAFRDPIAMATAARTLGEAFPGRYLLGLGGHRVDDTIHPLDGYPVPALGRAVSTMGAYLTAMDAVPVHSQPPRPAVRRVLAALGPRMLALAAERTWGAHPYFVPVDHTRQAREILGPEAFLGSSRPLSLTPTPTGRARSPQRTLLVTSPWRLTKRRACGVWASATTTWSAGRAVGWSTRSSSMAMPRQSGTEYAST